MSGDGEEALGERIERYARSFAERTGMSVQADCALGEVVLPPETAFGILRIVQEALTNAGKHSEAVHVEVTLACTGKTLTARVRDDGTGFLPSRSGANGIGLHSMRERAVSLGGELCVQSAPGEGAEIILTVPV
jgi:signal transduction histidine kinase